MHEMPWRPEAVDWVRAHENRSYEHFLEVSLTSNIFTRGIQHFGVDEYLSVCQYCLWFIQAEEMRETYDLAILVVIARFIDPPFLSLCSPGEARYRSDRSRGARQDRPACRQRDLSALPIRRLHRSPLPSPASPRR